MSTNRKETLANFLRDFLPTIKLTISVPKSEIIDIYEDFLNSDELRRIDDLKKSLGCDSAEVLMLIQQAKSKISRLKGNLHANSLHIGKSLTDEPIEYELFYDPISESFQVTYDHVKDEDEIYIDAEGHLTADPEKQSAYKDFDPMIDHVIENFLEQKGL